jgi:hypothetical protein
MSLLTFARWLLSPCDDPIHTTCVRIALTLVAGLCVVVVIVEIG